MEHCHSRVHAACLQVSRRCLCDQTRPHAPMFYIICVNVFVYIRSIYEYAPCTIRVIIISGANLINVFSHVNPDPSHLRHQNSINVYAMLIFENFMRREMRYPGEYPLYMRVPSTITHVCHLRRLKVSTIHAYIHIYVIPPPSVASALVCHSE